MRFEIRRSRKSFAYKRNEKSNPDWHNNDFHNSLDEFTLFDKDGKDIFSTNCQTVSNTEGLVFGARYIDTLASGDMSIKTDVEPRLFNGRIHGVVKAMTIAGEEIRSDSTSKTNPARWLVHDWQKLKPAPVGQDTRAAWSAGCIVLPTKALAEFGGILDKNGIKPGTIIPGKLIEED